MGRIITIDDHVDSIIDHRGPVLATKRVKRHTLDQILNVLERRVQGNPKLEFLARLPPYYFKGTDQLWQEDGKKDYDLAREMTNEIAQTIMRKKRWTFRQFVQKVSQNDFRDTKVGRWGATGSGMMSAVYGGSHIETVIDLVKHDRRYSSYRDIHQSDFNKAGGYSAEDRYEMMHRFVTSLRKEKGWSFVQVIQNIDKELMQNFKFSRFGATLTGMMDYYEDSPAFAFLDLVNNDKRYKQWNDLKVYDFQHVRNLWRRYKRPNVKLGREAIQQFWLKMNKERRWSRAEFVAEMSDKMFRTTPINRYGTTLSKMMSAKVHKGRYERAVRDWYRHAA